ncbi:MAG: L,D-transpeptidase family protein [Deltaproteobacteria bacterium]|nr:L,D-transpeptidase family protein [Deltaproteobacteria bacterium]
MNSLRPCFRGFALTIVVAVALAGGAALAREWKEEDFLHKTGGTHFMVVAGRDWRTAQSVVGSTRFYQVQRGDTFLDLARYYGLGYNELVEANPGVDVWVPPAGQIILLPTEYIIPEVEPRGVVVNIPEMRLYYFHPRHDEQAPLLVTTYPVGLGRDDWKTPQGRFKVRGKTVNPTWVLPESIRAEHRRDGKPAPPFIAGGSPDNPLGKYRVELTLPLYGIHGTNIPWGVGMQVSHGCIRLYPEDIEQLFPVISIGDAGEFVYQPVKIGARNGEIYAEIHKDIYEYTPGPYREAQRLLQKFGWADRIDDQRLRRAIAEQSGVPMLISRDAGSESVIEERFRPRTGQAGPRGGRTQSGTAPNHKGRTEAAPHSAADTPLVDEALN